MKEDGTPAVPSSFILYSILLSNYLLLFLLLLFFLLLLEGNEINHLGGIGIKIGLLLVLGELGLKPIPHELVGTGLLQGTGLDYLKLGNSSLAFWNTLMYFSMLA